MGTEKFNYIKPAVAHGDNVQLQYAVQGDPVSGKMRSNASTNENVKAAGLFSTAPYKPPKAKTVDEGLTVLTGPRPMERMNKCLGNADECGAWATATGYCWAHTRSLRKKGLL